MAKGWATGRGDWRRRARDFMSGNAGFRKSIIDQLRDRGALQSRDIDESELKVGWESTGWTHGKNTGRMLEFMGVCWTWWSPVGRARRDCGICLSGSFPPMRRATS